jgi:hypothetical protein
MSTFEKLMLIAICIIWRFIIGYRCDLIPPLRASEPIPASVGGLDLTNEMESAPLCNLQWRGSPKDEMTLSALASAVILVSEPRGNLRCILLSQIRHSPYLEGHFPVFVSPGTAWPRYTPRNWIAPPLSSPQNQSQSQNLASRGLDRYLDLIDYLNTQLVDLVASLTGPGHNILAWTA